MLKVSPHPDYPPEEGRYIRGNDFSPVAVAIILNCDADKIPSDLEKLVRVGIESGAVLSGTVQTENIGFEKIVCNIVALMKRSVLPGQMRPIPFCSMCPWT
jgi:tetrahydromethanopterin S-methyltransferase subunit A